MKKRVLLLWGALALGILLLVFSVIQVAVTPSSPKLPPSSSSTETETATTSSSTPSSSIKPPQTSQVITSAVPGTSVPQSASVPSSTSVAASAVPATTVSTVPVSTEVSSTSSSTSSTTSQAPGSSTASVTSAAPSATVLPSAKPPHTSKAPSSAAPSSASNTASTEGEKLEEILRPAQITLLRPVASGILTKSNDSVLIDYSNFKDGYVMVKYLVSSSVRLKVQVQGPTTTYTYNITPMEWTVFPLSDGNGDYRIKVFKNVVDNRYSVVISLSFNAQMTNEFAPFLRPNQYVNYENAVNTMQKGAELCAGKTDTLKKVEAIYSYVITNLSYDYEKAKNVTGGYCPELDKVLAAKKGICFDYAALMAGMLRSQNIACKLVVGYANTEYHAWINVWTPDKGWVDGAIFFDGTKWQLMDPTYASSTNNSAIINKVNYTSKYVY